MIYLKSITPGMVALFKDVRLRALKDTPLAFSSTYAKESRLPDEEWIKRSQRWDGHEAILYLAFDDADEATACGIVACYREQEAGVVHGQVISMWVDPRYRRAGVGKLLIGGVKSWAILRGLRELKLMVTSVNQGAIDFYRRIGFRMSGMTSPYPNDPEVTEYQMFLPLRG